LASAGTAGAIVNLRATEAETQAAVLELLAAHRIYAGRLNTGAGFVNGRPVQHHTFGKGCADILAFPAVPMFRWGGTGVRITPTWIECKASGKKQRPEQVTFQEFVESLGHKYLLVDSVDQVIEWIKTL
jgi:hypothetical protein